MPYLSLKHLAWIFAGAIAGVLVVMLMHGSHAAEPSDLVRKTVVYSSLDSDAPDPGLQMRFRIDKPQRVAVWTQSHYDGTISVESVRELIASGSADSLEYRLRARYKKQLAEHLREFDQSFRELSLLTSLEAQEVKQKLRSRPERCIIIRSLPREKDPAFAKLLEARAKVENGGLGAVWGEGLVRGKSEIHFVVLWKEWPALRRLHKEQAKMIHERRRLVREWIKLMYAEDGIAMFS